MFKKQVTAQDFKMENGNKKKERIKENSKESRGETNGWKDKSEHWM